MYINEKEQTILARIAIFGPARAGKGDILRALYNHFAAQNGPDTHFQVKLFEPRETLEEAMGPDESAKVIASVEDTFGAPYDEVADAGSLLWLRTVLPTGAGRYDRALDVFTVSGNAWYSALRNYTLTGADCVIFVADGRPDRAEASLEMWEELVASYSGPKVVLVNHALTADFFVEDVGFEGAAFAENGGFSDTLSAFDAASNIAIRQFSSSN